MTAPTLTVTLLGAPRLTLDNTPVTTLPSAKVAALAYYLAATARPQSRDTLAALLWPDYDTSQAKKNLRGALYHLRNGVGDHLHATRNAATLDPMLPRRVDAVDFAAAVQAAHGSGGAVDLAALESAAQLYTGDFLDGFHLADAEPFEEWLLAERARLKRLAIQTLYALTAAALADGRTLQGIDYATRLLVLDPFHEETHRHLMLLLAQDGQPQAALAHFDTCRALLESELGVVPDAATTALAARIAQGDMAGAPVHIDTGAAHRRVVNVPTPRTPLVDREEAQAQTLAWLADPACRIITITGVGGVGKSRLALQLGARAGAAPVIDQPDEAPVSLHDIAFVPLAGVEPDAEVQTHIAGAMADALGIRFTGEEQPQIQLQTAISARRTLLILDNFEQLHEQGAPVLVALLDACPNLKLVVTSRTRLNLRGEHLLALPGLPSPDEVEDISTAGDLIGSPAAQLFLQTAATVNPAFTPDDAAARAIAAICRLLNGLPLGIELAAHWTRLLSVEEIAAELQQSLDLLQGTQPDLPPRQRSLRAVFDYSWTLLTPDEQTLLARLSVFRGGFTTRAAQAVTGATLMQLAALDDKSLLARRDDTPSARFEIPEVLRQYAAEKLAQRTDAASTHAAHADYYADRLNALAADIRGGDQPDALDRVAHEIENMRAAYRWTGAEIEHDPARALARIARSMAGLFDFYDIRGWYAEGRAVFAGAAEAVGGAAAGAVAEDAGTHTALLAALRARQGWLTFLTGDVDEAATLLSAARTLAEAADDPHTLAFTLNYLGALRRHAGDLADATDLLTRGLTLAETAGDRYTVSLILNTLGQVASLQGDAAAATGFCQRALAIKRQLGDRRGMIYSLTYLGRVAEMDGRVDAARPLYAESLQIAEELDDPRGIALSQHNLANAALTQGQLAGARRLFNRALELYRAMGSRADMSVALSRLAEVALAQRDYEEAIDCVGDALTLAQAAGVQPARSTALLAAGALLAQTGDTATAGAVMATVAAAPHLTARQRLRLEQLQDRVAETPDAPAASPQATVDLVFAALEQLRRAPLAPARSLP